MKKFLLATTLGLSVFLTAPVLAQNKSLGVGVATPNENAALHVESPTGNQGFIMPRLTTAQRTAMGSLLTATDNGLMLYDTDLNNIFIWDGSQWKTTAEVAGETKLAYPYKDSVVTATGTTDLFALKYNNPEHKRVLRVENLNRANGSSTLSVSNNGSGVAGYFQNLNDTTASSTLYAVTNSNYSGQGLLPVAVYGESSGTGSLAAAFRISNADNPNSAIWAETNGMGAGLYSKQLGAGNGIVAEVDNPDNEYRALFAVTNGNGQAAQFVKNGTSGGHAVLIQSSGAGAIFADNNGANGVGAVFQNINSDNPSAALYTEAVGVGPSAHIMKSTDAIGGDALLVQNSVSDGNAARFEINNTESVGMAVSALSAGVGAAVFAENTFDGDAIAGLFRNTGESNSYPAIQTENYGTGPGIATFQGSGTGPGVVVNMDNPMSESTGVTIHHANLGQALWIESTNEESMSATVHVSTAGMGAAGHFETSNTTTETAALRAITQGTGPAIEAVTATGYTAFYARRDGASAGNAGVFETSDAENTYPTVQVTTSGSGAGINVTHSGANGDAIYAQHSGQGNAATFNVDNASGGSAAVYAETNANLGYAIQARNTANGRAMSIGEGGLQISTLDVRGQATQGMTTIAQRASAYLIDAESAFELDPAAVPLTEGDIFYVYNVDEMLSTTFNGINISGGTGVVLIYMGGALRAFGGMY